MEIRQLKYFVAIAECGSFSEASRKFFLSQSAISQQIKLLEDELGVVLFMRSPHKVVLSEDGEQMLPMARKVLEDVKECRDRMTDVKDELSGELHIGLTCSMEPMVRRAMVLFMRKFPNVRLFVYYKTIPELIYMLRNRQLDMAFSMKVEGEEDWVDSVPIFEYRFAAVMRDTHPLATRKELSFTDLERQSLVLPEKMHRFANAVEDFLSKEGARLCVRAVVNDASAIMNLLRSSNFVSILPEHLVRGIDDLKAVDIAELKEKKTSYVHTLKGVTKKRSVDAFISSLSPCKGERGKGKE